MTTEGVLRFNADIALHGYLIDFALGNVERSRQAQFVADMWCDIGVLAEEYPSLHCIAEVVWRRMIQYEPILAKQAEGYTTREMAVAGGMSHQAISKRKKKVLLGCQKPRALPTDIVRGAEIEEKHSLR